MARNCNGTSQRITYPTDTALNITGDLSLCCWVKLNAFNLAHQFVNKKQTGATTATPYIFHTTNDATGRLQFFRQGTSGGANLVSTGGLAVGVWKHIGITVANSTGRNIFHFNGVPEAFQTHIDTVTTNTQPLFIGGRNDNVNTNCVIAHVGIYNVTLTAGEITQAMMKGYINRGLVFYAPLYGTGTLEADLSGSRRTSTITGTSVVAGPPLIPYIDTYRNAALWYALQSSVVVVGLPPKSRFNIPKSKPRKTMRTVYSGF